MAFHVRPQGDTGFGSVFTLSALISIVWVVTLEVVTIITVNRKAEIAFNAH